MKLEGAAIDLIGIPPLTNLIHGEGSKKYRQQRKSIDSNLDKMGTADLKGFIDSSNAKITEPGILIRINQLYRYGMSSDELYDSTRGIWVIGRNRECANYAFAVFKGYIIEVYKINSWHPAGTTPYKTRPELNGRLICEPPRWEFKGELAEKEIREKYLKKSVKNYLTANSQNPIRYVNC